MQAQQRRCESCGKMFTPRQTHFKFCDDCVRQRNAGVAGDRAASSFAGGGRDQPVSRLVRADGYLKDGYFDEHGHVRPEIVGMEGDSRPTLNSRSMVSRAVCALMSERVRGQNESGIRYTQLYKFYQQARATERRLRERDPFATIIADLEPVNDFCTLEV